MRFSVGHVAWAAAAAALLAAGTDRGGAAAQALPDPPPIINYPNITLRVDKAGRVRLEGRELADAEIVPALVASRGQRGTVRITVLGEHQTPPGRLNEVLAIVTSGGFPLAAAMVEGPRW